MWGWRGVREDGSLRVDRHLGKKLCRSIGCRKQCSCLDHRLYVRFGVGQALGFLLFVGPVPSPGQCYWWGPWSCGGMRRGAGEVEGPRPLDT